MNFKTFVVEYEKLKNQFPKAPNAIVGSEGSEYGDYIVRCRNVYYGFVAAECENSFYLYDSFQDKDCADCSYAANNELCYESVDNYQCYRSIYLEDCANARDCSYCVWCNNCNDCFGCVLLTHQKFCFFNKQLSEADYHAKVAEYATKTPAEILVEVNKLRRTMPAPPQHFYKNEQTDYGEYIYFNERSYYLFDATRDIDCGYLFDSHRCKTSWDIAYSVSLELCAETLDSAESFRCYASKDLVKCSECDFGYDLVNCHNTMGCVYLKNQDYCILNKKYSPEEYEKLKAEIWSTYDYNLLSAMC